MAKHLTKDELLDMPAWKALLSITRNWQGKSLKTGTVTADELDTLMIARFIDAGAAVEKHNGNFTVTLNDAGWLCWRQMAGTRF